MPHPGAHRRFGVPSFRACAALAALFCAVPALPASATPADRAELKKNIDALLAQPPLSSARVSAQVVSLEDAHVVYARGADDQLNPASNTKLVTSAAALIRLGPEFRFTTDVLADKPPVRGRVGTLYVKGRGDPAITTERLQGLVADLWHRGLRQVGDLVLDDTYFDRESWGPGWEQETSDKSWAAPVGALSLNHNSVGIYVASADSMKQRPRIDLEPEARGYFTLENRVSTVRPGARRRVVPHTVADGEHTRVVVSGRLAAREGSVVLYRRVTDPSFYFGYAMKQLLEERGIRVRGHVRRGTAPEDATLLNAYDSPELAEVVRDMNKVSSNFIAEMLVKTLGAELRGVPGTWAKGLEVTQDLLAELGLPRGTYQLRNGSGLNDTNRFSAQQMTALLVAVWKRFPVASEFVSSLGIAARDGTLRLRMEGTDAAGRLRGKTGTLEKVTALSGYVQSLGGERFVFSILVNDWSGRASPVLSGVDRFGGLLASVGGPEPTAREAALLLLAGQQAAEASPAELKARIATYAALAQSPDKKNLPFLRTALRSERDPLLRAVVADALYRSDPDAGGGALLEAVPPSPDLFVRLRALGRELALPLPLVPSLLDLAAEGSGEALSRILAVAPLARGPLHDEALEHTLAEGLLDVGEAAPDETLTALRLAAPAQSQAAIELIAVGLAQSGGDGQKFPLAQAVREAVARGGAGESQAQGWLAMLEHRTSPAAAPQPSSSTGAAPGAAATATTSGAPASAATAGNAASGAPPFGSATASPAAAGAASSNTAAASADSSPATPANAAAGAAARAVSGPAAATGAAAASTSSGTSASPAAPPAAGSVAAPAARAVPASAAMVGNASSSSRNAPAALAAGTPNAAGATPSVASSVASAPRAQAQPPAAPAAPAAAPGSMPVALSALAAAAQAQASAVDAAASSSGGAAEKAAAKPSGGAAVATDSAIVPAAASADASTAPPAPVKKPRRPRGKSRTGSGCARHDGGCVVPASTPSAEGAQPLAASGAPAGAEPPAAANAGPAAGAVPAPAQVGPAKAPPTATPALPAPARPDAPAPSGG